VAYTVEFLKTAERAIRKVPKPERLNLKSRIDALANDPRPPDSKLLKYSLEGYRRIRVGAYRAIYEIDDQASLVVIIAVGNRKWIYTEK